MTLEAVPVPAAERPHRRSGLVGLLLVALPVLLMGWLVLYPIADAVWRTLVVSNAGGTLHLSTDTYETFFSDPYSRRNLWLTLRVTATCAGLLLVIGLPIALYLRFSRSRIAALVQALAIFPLFVPSVILAYALIRTIGPNGTVDILLNAVGLPKLPTPYLTPWGPTIGLVWDNLPLTVLMLAAGLGAVSDSAVEAARDVGAGRWAVFRHIILPRIRISILVALSFSVLGIFSAFTLPYVLGPASPEMMGPFMQRTFADLNDPRMAVTQAVITFGFCLAFGLFYVRAIARNRSGPS
ncbi:ABC transporter permease [Aureimonas leprariae]|uniref:ABC transporter permease subunit n=1 Tax=Plantimonas leprariae TaxID=2615207 RepID=A0A7V7PMM1_9HYPH|nr:ABC transporter permease subunit [Aureimonas leprariae]KAB0678505.1 ABC transporter permease subunit [Aureimonas leprariae]